MPHTIETQDPPFHVVLRPLAGDDGVYVGWVEDRAGRPCGGRTFKAGLAELCAGLFDGRAQAMLSPPGLPRPH